MVPILVVLYLLIIVVANGIVAAYGQPALAVTAWVLIPFDMTVRSTLQRVWEGDKLFTRMALLISSGSLLSALLGSTAAIANASFAAFLLAGTAEALVFWWARRTPRLVRVNAANLCAAVVDSFVFQLVAFGGVVPYVFASQTLAKTLGGAAWSVVLIATVWKLADRHRAAAGKAPVG